jgi:hypothetical protein
MTALQIMVMRMIVNAGVNFNQGIGVSRLCDFPFQGHNIDLGRIDAAAIDPAKFQASLKANRRDRLFQYGEWHSSIDQGRQKHVPADP